MAAAQRAGIANVGMITDPVGSAPAPQEGRAQGSDER